MEDRHAKSPSRPFISLKDIPPLDPSSIPTNITPSSLPLKPRTMMAQDNKEMQRFEDESEFKFKKVEQDNAFSSFSNIQIDPNSTTSAIILTHDKNLLPKPEEELDIKPKSQVYGPDGSKRGSAKSVLHEICASKRWRPPVYECCKAQGPCHMRLFTYKVVVKPRDSSGRSVLECFGDPKPNKKAAAEHAAEGALWYLEHVKRDQTKPHHH